MSFSARETALDSVLPGSVLAAELRDVQGAVLLPKGASVTEATLLSLRRRGIETLVVLVEQADDPEREAASRQEIEQQLRHLFRLAGDEAPARQLLQMIREYRGRRPA